MLQYAYKNMPEEKDIQPATDPDRTGQYIVTESALFGKEVPDTKTPETHDIDNTASMEEPESAADWVKMHLFYILLAPMILIWLVLVLMIVLKK